MFFRILSLLIHIGIWLGGFLLISPLPFGVISYKDQVSSPLELTMDSFYATLLSAALFYIYAYLVLPSFMKTKNLKNLFLANILCLLVFTFLETLIDVIFWMVLHAGEPLNLLYLIRINLIFKGVVLFAANLYGFAWGWFREQRTRNQLEQEKLKAELSALKHQIHPHFLFNILNGLYSLAHQNDDDITAEGIAKLSNMMRYMLYEANGSRVSLNKELSYIQDYIDLQRLRLQSNTRVSFELEGNPQNKTIAPLIFIPFIENTFKYGTSTMHPSEIRISIEVSDKNIRFHSTNRIHRRNSESLDEVGGIGLSNVKKRLQLLYPNSYHLSIDDSGQNYVVNLSIGL